MPVTISNCIGIGDSRNPDQSIKSVLIMCLDTEQTEWIPDWAIDVDSEVYKKDTEGNLLIDRSMAIKKGLKYQCRS